MIPDAAVLGLYLRAWMRRRLAADIETAVPTDEMVRYLPAAQRLRPVADADDSPVEPRSFPYCEVRGHGDTPLAAISAFQHDLEMRVRLPWRVRRVFWRHAVLLEGYTDFERDRLLYSAFARFAFEPTELEAPS